MTIYDIEALAYSGLHGDMTYRLRRVTPPTAPVATLEEACAQLRLGDPTDAPAQAASPQPPRPNPIAEAERYALQHRKRAVLIRRLGHLPPKFGWLAPEVVFTIATGTTPILCALDEKPARTTALAA